MLATVTAGYMALDGTRALVKGDYITPKSGQYAGQLGPWTKLAEAVGIEPRSTLMKSIFALYGFCWLFVVVSYIRKKAWGRMGMIVAAIGSLWNLFFGTASSLIQIFLLYLEARVERRPQL